MNAVFIAPKPLKDFTPDEFHLHVVNMFTLPRRKGKSASPAPGLSVNRTKTGKISIRRTAKSRAFAYVTGKEIELLAKAIGSSQSELWNEFKKKKFIFAQNRLEAEKIYADVNSIPW